jgi:hypothetical protein
VTTPRLHRIAEILAASPDDFILDAGCGDGFYLGGRTEKRLSEGLSKMGTDAPTTTLTTELCLLLLEVRVVNMRIAVQRLNVFLHERDAARPRFRLAMAMHSPTRR